jgi:hypothetical protein
MQAHPDPDPVYLVEGLGQSDRPSSVYPYLKYIREYYITASRDKYKGAGQRSKYKGRGAKVP